MKRLVYGIVAAGLAVGLVGCGESGGGVWPNTPMAPALTGGQVQPLGGDVAADPAAVAAAKGALGIDTAITAGSPADVAVTSIAALPAVSDFGVTIPTLGGTVATPFGSIKAAVNKRKLSDATSAGLTLATSDKTGFTKLTTTAKTYGNYSYTYTMNVKFMDKDGKAITPDLSTTRTEFWGVSDTVFGTVNTVQFFGTSTVAYKMAAVQSSSGSIPASDYTMTCDFGTEANPCVVTNILGTDYGYMSNNSTWKVSGTVGGQTVTTAGSSTISGTSTSGSFSNLYKFPKTYSYGNFGYGTMMYSGAGYTAKVVVDGTKYSYYVNDVLVFTYPSSSSSSYYGHSH
jgi:hypothetical protein